MHVIETREQQQTCARPGCGKPVGGWDQSPLCCACALEAELFERERRWQRIVNKDVVAASECSR